MLSLSLYFSLPHFTNRIKFHRYIVRIAVQNPDMKSYELTRDQGSAAGTSRRATGNVPTVIVRAISNPIYVEAASRTLTQYRTSRELYALYTSLPTTC